MFNTKPTKKKISKLQLQEWVDAYKFLSLQLIGFVVFLAGPLVLSVYYTFTNWDLIAPEPTFVGLKNWEYFFSDPRIGDVFNNTFRYILYSTPAFLILSLFLAIILNRTGKKTGGFKTFLLLPWVMSQVAVGVTWKWMFNSRSGPAALVLAAFGVDNSNLLVHESTAMIGIAVMTTWQLLGYGLILFSAGLNTIPNELHEAAVVDGANEWQVFSRVTLPLLSPTILFLTITSLIGAFQLYDPIVIMATGTSSAGMTGLLTSLRTIVLYLYQQMFDYSEAISGLGYAAVIGWALAILIFTVTLLQWVLSKKWLFTGYDNED
jgi:multiple sugar transport system permease protein